MAAASNQDLFCVLSCDGRYCWTLDGRSAAAAPSSRVIVITSGKGGVGKITAAADLGMSIARPGWQSKGFSKAETLGLIL